MKKIQSIALLLAISAITFAQRPTVSGNTKGEQMSERDIKLQERFIEATREKVLDNFEKADELLQKLAADDPKNAEVHFQWATVLYARKQYDQSAAQAKFAYDLEPSNSYFAQFYGERLEQKGAYREAALVYQALCKSKTVEKGIYLQQGLMWLKAKDSDAALKAFNALEERAGGATEETVKRKYVLYDALGKKEKAVAELQRLIDRFPRTIEYRHWLADYYKSVKEPAKAAAVYADILKIDPSDGHAMIASAKNAEQKGDEVQFVRALRGLFSRTDVSVENKIKQLLPYLEEGNIKPEVAKEALGCAQILAETHPKDAVALSFYADLLYKNGQKEAALTQFKLSAEADKKRFYPWQYILIINMELEKFDNVLRESEAAMDYFPNQPLVYYMNGVANYQKDKYPAALDMMQQALPMLGRNSTMQQDVQHQLGRIYTALKQYDKATTAFEEALKGEGANDANTQQHYGDLLDAQGKKAEAQAAWQKAKKLKK